MIIKNISELDIDLSFDNGCCEDFEYFMTLRPGEEINTKYIVDNKKINFDIIRITKNGGYILQTNSYIKIIEEGYTPFTRFEIMEI